MFWLSELEHEAYRTPKVGTCATSHWRFDLTCVCGRVEVFGENPSKAVECFKWTLSEVECLLEDLRPCFENVRRRLVIPTAC